MQARAVQVDDGSHLARGPPLWAPDGAQDLTSPVKVEQLGELRALALLIDFYNIAVEATILAKSERSDMSFAVCGLRFAPDNSEGRGKRAAILTSSRSWLERAS